MSRLDRLARGMAAESPGDRNVRFLRALAISIARDLIRGDWSAIDQFEAMRSEDAAYLAVRVAWQLSEDDAPAQILLRYVEEIEDRARR